MPEIAQIVRFAIKRKETLLETPTNRAAGSDCTRDVKRIA